MPLRLLLSKFDGMFTKQQLQLLDVNDEAYLVLDDDDDDSNNNDDDDDDDDDRDDDDGDAFDVNDPGFNNNATDDERRQLVRAAQKAAFDSNSRIRILVDGERVHSRGFQIMPDIYRLFFPRFVENENVLARRPTVEHHSNLLFPRVYVLREV
jgi:hypothetical protein